MSSTSKNTRTLSVKLAIHEWKIIKIRCFFGLALKCKNNIIQQKLILWNIKHNYLRVFFCINPKESDVSMSTNTNTDQSFNNNLSAVVRKQNS